MARPTNEGLQLTTIETTIDQSGNISNTPFTSDTSGHLMHHWLRQYSGSVTPGYKGLNQRQRKKLQTLGYTLYVRRDFGYKFARTVVNTNQPQFWTKYNAGTSVHRTPYPIATHLVEALAIARARAADKVNKLTVNLAQAFGERKQTANLMADTAVRVVALARAVRHGNPNAFLAALGQSGKASEKKLYRDFERINKTPVSKRLSNHWLELQYGWKPLLQDVYGAAEIICGHIQNDRFTDYVTGSGKARVVTISGNGRFTTPRIYRTVETKTKIGIAYRLDSPDRARLAQTGIDNPALLAWELLPYSFVVDWFLPVGNYLEALNAFSGFTFVDGWQSDMTKETINQEYYAKNYPVGNVTESVTGFASRFTLSYNRKRLDTFPGVGRPTFKNPIGGDPLGRFLTATALLRVLFK